MVDSICKEIILQSDYLKGEQIETIYLGGGTPSLLNESEINKIMATVYSNYSISPHPEITLEANPDDLNKANLKIFMDAGINRLSLGIQSFNNDNLKYLNRVHSAEQSVQVLELVQNSGIKNSSIDLIYAIPVSSHKQWKKDIEFALQFQPEHISSYCLTIEPKTVFGKWLKEKKITDIEENFAADQYEILTDLLSKAGYEQYEISNFARDGYYSKHNSSYWQQKKYVGFGPGAHSYNKTSRQYNISNNSLYIAKIQEGIIPFTLEILSKEDIVNEYLLTNLRTKWGCDLQRIKEDYSVDIYKTNEAYIGKNISEGLLLLNKGVLNLTGRGKLLADKIASDLFL